MASVSTTWPPPFAQTHDDPSGTTVAGFHQLPEDVSQTTQRKAGAESWEGADPDGQGVHTGASRPLAVLRLGWMEKLAAPEHAQKSPLDDRAAPEGHGAHSMPRLSKNELAVEADEMHVAMSSEKPTSARAAGGGEGRRRSGGDAACLHRGEAT